MNFLALIHKVMDGTANYKMIYENIWSYGIVEQDRVRREIKKFFS